MHIQCEFLLHQSSANSWQSAQNIAREVNDSCIERPSDDPKAKNIPFIHSTFQAHVVVQEGRFFKQKIFNVIFFFYHFFNKQGKGMLFSYLMKWYIHCRAFADTQEF